MVIQRLKDSEKQSLTTREVARHIASHEKNLPISQATGEPYRNAYNALSQTHLPTLSEAGIISIYDPKRQTVQTGTHFELAALLLDTNTSMANVVASLVESERERETADDNC